MPLRRAREWFRQLEAQVEEAFLIGHCLDPYTAERTPQPRSGRLVAREAPDHVVQVHPRRVVLTGAGDARHLKGAALEKELARRAVSPVGQYLERVQQPKPPLQPEPEPVEAHLGGVRPHRYRPPPVRKHLPVPPPTKAARAPPRHA